MIGGAERNTMRQIVAGRPSTRIDANFLATAKIPQLVRTDRHGLVPQGDASLRRKTRNRRQH